MKKVLVGFLALAIIQVLGGCGENQDTATGPGGTGVISVRLTDAPAVYDALTIVVDSVRVHVDSGDTVSGWYTISRGPAHYDLLTYVNGRDTVIAEGPVPSGRYTQMRLYIGSGGSVTRGGRVYPLVIPSGMQSGLKLNIQADIVSGATYEVALDFEADHSIVATGSGGYVLKPVIKVITTALSGSLTGQVLPDTADAAVLAIMGTDTTTTVTGPSGHFTFKYLVPGLYLVRCTPADTSYQIKDLPNEEVAAGQMTDIGAVILQVR